MGFIYLMSHLSTLFGVIWLCVPESVHKKDGEQKIIHKNEETGYVCVCVTVLQ